jgi:hypothetical protein
MANRPTERREWFRIAKDVATGRRRRDFRGRVHLRRDRLVLVGAVSTRSSSWTRSRARRRPKINLYLNSPGGAAWDGIAIMNALQAAPGDGRRDRGRDRRVDRLRDRDGR